MRKRSHIPALDGLRGLAVLMVFVYHYGGGMQSSIRAMRIFGAINKGGWTGVTLFFLLSGFLITGILWDSLGEPHWWRNFYARRTLRIFPLYFGTLLLVMAAAALVGAFRQAASQIWIPALFLQNMPYLIDQVDHIGSPLSLFHFWSLAVEEQFYLVWPFLLLLQKSQRSARRLCVTVFALSFVFRVLIVKFNPHWQEYVEFLLSRGGELAVGCWLAICYRGPAWSRLERLAPYAAVAGLAGFTVSGIVGGTFELFSPLMVIAGLPSATVLFAALLVLSLRPGLVQQVASWGWLRWTGGISYGIYVFHMLFVAQFSWIARHIFGEQNHTRFVMGEFIVAATGSVLAAWLSFHFFETPFLRLKRRFAPTASQVTAS
ncbi:MAG: acyltransferase [Edaphobacter sp.]